ncbi:MAG: hypothetical protein QME07_00565 [bacterium]|nr:hypothetical protein [bacterium]
MDILKEIIGVGLVIIGVVIMQYAWRYNLLGENYFGAFILATGAFFLIFLGFRLCGFLLMNALFLYPIVILMISGLVQAIPMIDLKKIGNILGIILGILMIATFIFVWWFECTRTVSGEKRKKNLDRYVEDTLFGTSTKTMKRNESQ